MTINRSYGLYKNVKIVFHIEDNKNQLIRLADKRIQYSQVKVENNSIKYYTFGVEVVNTKKYKQTYSQAMPIQHFTDYVALVSVNSELEPDWKTTAKFRRRIFIPFQLSIAFIECGGVRYNEPPVLDLHKIDYVNTVIDFKNNMITIKCRVPQTLEFEQSRADFTYQITAKYQPIIDMIKETNELSPLDPFKEEFGANAVMKIIVDIAKNTRLLTSEEPLAKTIRERLTKLFSGDTNVQTGLYKGYFMDKPEYIQIMTECGNDESKAIRYKIDMERLRNMRDNNIPLEERIDQLSWEEINERNPQAMIGPYLALTEEEEAVYWTCTEDESRRFELMARDRWLAQHPDHPANR